LINRCVDFILNSNNIESGDANQAIDSSIPIGLSNDKIVKNLYTPDGNQKVICLLDKDIDLNIVQDYLLHYKMPEIGHVYSDRIFSSTDIGDTILVSPPVLNSRTKEQLKFCEYFNGHIIVKLMCKPALVQAQQFWVSRSFSSNAANTAQHLSEVGFLWKPSVDNEIFVLMPWASEHYVEKLDTDLSTVFGNLVIKNVTNLLTTDTTEILWLLMHILHRITLRCIILFLSQLQLLQLEK
jgi:hypothetical protein